MEYVPQGTAMNNKIKVVGSIAVVAAVIVSWQYLRRKLRKEVEQAEAFAVKTVYVAPAQSPNRRKYDQALRQQKQSDTSEKRPTWTKCDDSNVIKVVF